MHSKNIHNEAYNFEELTVAHPALKSFVILNKTGNSTIDFSSSKAVLHLNKALLKLHYKVENWGIPAHYLCPPIPGRADYIHHINDLLIEEGITQKVKGLDIGVGANCIYPILGATIYNWKMVGSDIDESAIISAKRNASSSETFQELIEIRPQINNANIFEGIIKEGEYFHFTMCNPPFHTSEEEAAKGTLRKLRNLQSENQPYQTKKEIVLNFGGQANELWCNGGEALFLKRMIKQSVAFKDQVRWFTCLVSKKENLQKIKKQLDKLKATYKTIPMSQGNKKSRFIAWKF